MPRTLTMRRGPDSTYSAKPELSELDSMAHWMDSRFKIAGIRFGLDSIMGLVPGVGDVASAGMSLFILGQAYRLGARKRTMVRMGANVLGDMVFGSIPVLGTVVDVVWKANRANMRLLRRDLERPEALRRL